MFSFMFSGKGQRKRLGAFLEPFPFRFVMELLEGFCYSSQFQERKPQLFVQSQTAGVNQRGSHICISCGAISHA